MRPSHPSLIRPTGALLRLPSVLLSLLIGLAVFASLAGAVSWWHSSYEPFVGSSRYSVLTLVAAIGALVGWAYFRRVPLALSPTGFAISLAVLTCTDWLTRWYNLYQGPSIRGELLLGALATYLVLRARAWRVLGAFAIASAVLLLVVFLDTANGRLLFSDDHATFLFRLQLLKENFPRIPFYYPWWNGGLDARDFFATGAINVFLVSAPIVYLTDLLSSYNVVVAFVLFLFAPFVTYCAARLASLRVPAAASAAVMMLGVSLLWYRWVLKYGTMGFAVSAVLVPLNLVLASRIISTRERVSGWLLALFVVTSTIMLLWSPSGLVFLPLILMALTRLYVLLRRPALLVTAAAILALNLPWMSLFWSVSQVSRFVVAHRAESESSQPEKTFRHKARGLDLEQSMKVVRDTARSTSPLIIALALPGVLLMRRRFRFPFIATGAWLLGLGSIAVPLKPQLELDRMLVILAITATLPAAAALLFLFQRARRGTVHLFAAISAGAFLFAAPFASALIVGNRSVEQYWFAKPVVDELADAIRQYGGEGRTLFSGFILHDLSGGHLAPLTLKSGKPLIASTWAHNVWSYRQVIPWPYLERGDEGIEEYLTRMNVSAVVTHERPWREYFLARPEHYQWRWRQDGFDLFTRTAPSDGWFEEGAGTLEEVSGNSIVVRLITPNAVLRFTSFPFLEVVPHQACEITTREYPGHIPLIELRGCPIRERITIRSGAPLQRVLGGQPR